MKRTVGFVLGLLFTTACFASQLKVDASNVVVIEGVIQGDNILPIGDLLLKASERGLKQVDMIINSPGGSVVTGFRFMNMMDEARARGLKIRCFVPEIAASMAFGILVHCDERHALARSFLLWHRARVSVGGMFGAPMTAPQALAIGRDLMAVDNLILEETLAALGVEPKVVKYHFENETLHVGSNLHRLAPDFITSHVRIEGLFEALTNPEVPRPKQERGFFGWETGEIIYITDKLGEKK